MGVPALALRNGEIWFSSHRTPHRVLIDQLKRRSVGDPTFCREFVAKQASMQAIDTWTIDGLPDLYTVAVREIAEDMIANAKDVFAEVPVERRPGCVEELRELVRLIGLPPDTSE